MGTPVSVGGGGDEGWSSSQKAPHRPSKGTKADCRAKLTLGGFEHPHTAGTSPPMAKAWSAALPSPPPAAARLPKTVSKAIEGLHLSLIALN